MIEGNGINNPDLGKRRSSGIDIAKRFVVGRENLVLTQIGLTEEQIPFVRNALDYLRSPLRATPNGLEARPSSDSSNIGSAALIESPESGVVMVTITAPNPGILERLDQATRDKTITERFTMKAASMTSEAKNRLLAMYGGKKLPHLLRFFILDKPHAQNDGSIVLATHPQAEYGKVALPAQDIRGIYIPWFKTVLHHQRVQNGEFNDLEVVAKGIKERWRSLRCESLATEGLSVIARVANVTP